MYGVGKNAFHRFEIGDLCPHIGQMVGGEIADLGARLMPAFGGEREQRADFI
jgi:hypothetical protein